MMPRNQEQGNHNDGEVHSCQNKGKDRHCFPITAVRSVAHIRIVVSPQSLLLVRDQSP